VSIAIARDRKLLEFIGYARLGLVNPHVKGDTSHKDLKMNESFRIGSLFCKTMPERMYGLWQRDNLTIIGLKSLLQGEWFDPEIIKTMHPLTRILKYQNQYC
jgi:hypothetical protein